MVIFCVAIVLVATFVPPLAAIHSVAPPGRAAWLLIIGMNLVPLALGQAAALALGAYKSVSGTGSPARRSISAIAS